MPNDVMDKIDTLKLLRHMEALSQRNVRNFKYQLLIMHKDDQPHVVKYSHFDLRNIHAYHAELSAP